MAHKLLDGSSFVHSTHILYINCVVCLSRDSYAARSAFSVAEPASVYYCSSECTWDLNFGAWEILGYGFQDMVFRTWDLNFGAWEILGYGFQDMVFKIWDLNFGAWIFTLAVSKSET